uniref:Uncharacterized protein n=1 Tax=Setaria viridis TaxID=4556 RepID=A0A4U6VPS4_SETVI|nr:hypothetical protein SEVIR_2G058466v2 [Setaria viridis]
MISFPSYFFLIHLYMIWRLCSGLIVHQIVLKALYMRSLIGVEPVLGVGWIVYPESLMQGRILN